jgi:hypothetical protein
MIFKILVTLLLSSAFLFIFLITASEAFPSKYATIMLKIARFFTYVLVFIGGITIICGVVKIFEIIWTK